MKTSIFFASALSTGVFALPRPDFFDPLSLFGAKVTVPATVTVTKQASACLSVAATGGADISLSLPGIDVGATSVPTTSGRVPIVQTPGVPVVPQTTLKTQSLVPAPTTTPVVTLPIPDIDRVTGAAQAYLSAGAAYQAAILYHHNAARANHGAAPLTWDASAEANARITANTCNFAHYIPLGANQGQNIYTTSSDAFNVTAGITEVWYKNEFSATLPWLGFANIPATIFPGIGHLTQMVWKDTTKVGCASVDCGSKMLVGGLPSKMNKFTVCNYGPAGNVGGSFALNVGRPISTSNLGKWTD